MDMRNKKKTAEAVFSHAIPLYNTSFAEIKKLFQLIDTGVIAELLCDADDHQTHNRQRQHDA